MSSIFNAIIYKPLYNGFIILIDFFPWLDVGVLLIVFTVIVKFILYPLSRKAVVAQMELKKLEPELNKIKEQYKDNKEEQARKTMALYKDRNINPFSSIFVALIQIPIILALYFIFTRSGFPVINDSLLYSFTQHPSVIDMNFLGLVNIGHKSIFLSLLAAISSYFQMRFSMPAAPKKEGNPSFKDDLARSMSLQMRYGFPVIVFFISYSISGVIALYWLTSNIFTLFQEMIIRKGIKKTT